MASPEERLLRLIRGGGSPGAVTGAPLPPATTPAAINAGPLGRAPRPWSWPAWGWAAVNLGLGALVAVEAVLLIVLLVTPQPTVLATSTRPQTATPAQAAATTDVAAPITLHVARTLFQPGSGEAASFTATAGGGDTAAARRFNLVGVVDGEPPQAVIEDAQTTKTFFVTQGQPVIEGWVVESVGAGRVLLDRAGEKLELSL